MRKTITGLRPGQLYHVQFRSVGVNEVSEWSQRQTFQTSNDIVAPKKITGLTGSSIERAFKVSWTAPTQNTDNTPLTDLKDYIVTVEANSIVRTFYTSATTFDFLYEQNVNSFTTARPVVKFTVAARDLSLNSATDPATITLTNAAPVAATAFAVTSVTDALRFVWTPSTDKDVAFYRIYRGTSSSAITEKIYEGAAAQFLYGTQDYNSRFFRLSTVDNFGQETFTSGNLTAAPGQPGGSDTTPPAAPSWAANWFSIETDLSNPYILRKNVVLTWVANTGDADFDRYVLSYRKVGTTTFNQISVYNNSARLDGLTPNTNYEVSVASVDKTGNRSVSTPAPTELNTGLDTRTVPQPSAPVTGNYLGQMTVTWNGLPTSGTMPSDFSHVAIHVSTTNNFTPSASTLVSRISGANSTQRVIIGNLPFGTTQYVKLVAYDYSGNASSPSVQATGSAVRINGSDIQDATINSAKISNLEAGKITTGELSSNTRILAGPELDTHAELTGTGLKVFGKTSEVLDDSGNVIVPSTIREVVRLGTTSNDYFSIPASSGELLAGINENGEATFQGINVVGSEVAFMGVSLTDLLNERARGVVGKYERTTSSTNCYRTEAGMIEFYADVEEGREYRVVANMPIGCVTGGDNFVFNLRYTTNNTSPHVQSPLLISRAFTAPVANATVPGYIEGTLTSPTTGKLRILVSAIVPGSNGYVFINTSNNRKAVFTIEDLGIGVGTRMGGSSSGAYTGSDTVITPTPPPTAEDPDPTPVLTTYKRSYGAIWTATYQENNARITSVESLVQGRANPDTFSNGNKKAYIGFPNMTDDLAGADIRSMRLYLKNTNSYSSAGVDVQIGFHGYVNRPDQSLQPRSDYARFGLRFNRGEGRWIKIPSMFWPTIKSGGWRGISLGPGTTSNPVYEGSFDGASKELRPVLEISYIK